MSQSHKSLCCKPGHGQPGPKKNGLGRTRARGRSRQNAKIGSTKALFRYSRVFEVAEEVPNHLAGMPLYRGLHLDLAVQALDSFGSHTVPLRKLGLAHLREPASQEWPPRTTHVRANTTIEYDPQCSMCGTGIQ